MRTRNRSTCIATWNPRFSMSFPPLARSEKRAAHDVEDDVAEVVQHLGEDPEDRRDRHDDETREYRVLGHGLTAKAAQPLRATLSPSVSHDFSVRERRSRAQARS